jgi:hypothetical protein
MCFAVLCCAVLCCAVFLPQAHVEAVVSMCTADNIDTLLAGQPDFVLDAIDNIHTKVLGHSSQTARSTCMLTLFCAALRARINQNCKKQLPAMYSWQLDGGGDSGLDQPEGSA